MNKEENKTSVTIYKTEEGAQVSTVFDDKGEVWLSVKEIAKLYGRGERVIQKHILLTREEVSIVTNKLFAQYPQSPLRTINGKKSKTTKTVEVEHFSLDTILRIGYRVKSKEASIFRDWATKHLIAVATKGYSISDTIDEEQLTDLQSDVAYLTTSINSNFAFIANSVFTLNPAKAMSEYQVKLIRVMLTNAATGMNPSELILKRCNKDKPNCGLRSDIIPSASTAVVSMNYLTKEELVNYDRVCEVVYDDIIQNKPSDIKILSGIVFSNILFLSGFKLSTRDRKYSNRAFINKIHGIAMARVRAYLDNKTTVTNA